MPIHVVCAGCGAVNRVPEDKLRDAHEAAHCPKCRSPLFPGDPIDVDGSALDRHVRKSDLPVVVDFWASWCGPCRMMAPAFAEAADQMATAARFLKLDTEANREAAAAFGIRSVPTLILFRNGHEVARQSGAMNAAQIGRWISQAT